MSEVSENSINSVNTENTLQPFRASNYDKFDIVYATHMKHMYSYVEDDIKEAFNTYTENLIDEEAITRFKLLDAIDTFKYKFQNKSIINNDTNTNNDYSNWIKFTDEAFNYRPYQPCIIS